MAISVNVIGDRKLLHPPERLILSEVEGRARRSHNLDPCTYNAPANMPAIAYSNDSEDRCNVQIKFQRIRERSQI